MQMQMSTDSNDGKWRKPLVLPRKQTLVFCDLHKLIIYIRKGQHFKDDVLIKAKNNGISIKFHITVRKGAVKILSKLS